jgi:hypothetical protein
VARCLLRLLARGVAAQEASMRKLLSVALITALAGTGLGLAIGAATFVGSDGAESDPVGEHASSDRIEVATTDPSSPVVAPTVTAPPIARPLEHAEDGHVTLATIAQSRSLPTVLDEHPSDRDIDFEDVDSALRVRRLTITSAIHDREPEDDLTTLHAGDHDRVYAFLELENRGDETTVVVTFERDDGTITGDVELDIPANVGRWRTWAFTRHLTPGQWRAVVRDSERFVISDQSFDVE